MTRSRRRRWAEVAAAIILLAVALHVWSPIAAGLLVRGAHECHHEGRHERAESLLRAASWLRPGDGNIAECLASVGAKGVAPVAPH